MCGRNLTGWGNRFQCLAHRLPEPALVVKGLDGQAFLPDRFLPSQLGLAATTPARLGCGGFLTGSPSRTSLLPACVRWERLTSIYSAPIWGFENDHYDCIKIILSIAHLFILKGRQRYFLVDLLKKEAVVMSRKLEESAQRHQNRVLTSQIIGCTMVAIQ